MREPSRDERALVERLRKAADDFDACQQWHGNHEESDCEPHQSIQDEMLEASKAARDAAAAITSLNQEVEDGRIAIAGLNSDWNVAMRRAEAAERRLEEVRASLPPAFTAGMQMANAMFNLAQRGETTDDVRRQFDEMRKAWDAASPALASAIRSKSGASDV